MLPRGPLTTSLERFVNIYLSLCRGYYDLDEDGWIIADERGKLVLSRLKSYLGVVIGTNILQDWRHVPVEAKKTVVDYIHAK